MGLLGDGWDDPKSSAIMALAGGLLSSNSIGQGFARGVQGYQQALTDAEDRKMKRQMMALQMAGLTDQSEQRKLALAQAKQKQQLLESLLGQSNPVSADMQVGPIAPGQGSVYQQKDVGSMLQDPSTLAKLKMVGVDLTDVANFAKPKWENINGNLVNTNAPGFQGGFQPGMSVSSNGQVTAWQTGPNGQLVFGAPQGALETFAAYQNAGEEAKAKRDPLKVFNPATQREEFVPRSEVASGQPLQSFGPTPAQMEAIRRDAAANGITNPTIRWDSPAQVQSGRFAAGQSADEIAQAEAAKVTAKANAEKALDNTTKASDFKIVKDRMDVARTLLNAGPTQSGFGSLVDSGANFFGVSTPGADLAAGLDAASSWLVQNVPKAPGAQSEAELKDYKAAVGVVGDRTKPVSQRMQALKTAQDMIGVWENRGGSTQSPQVNAVPLPPNPTAQTLKPGTVYDTPKGLAEWDGFRFKKVQ